MPRPTPTDATERTGIRLLGTATYLSILIARHSFAFAVSVISACVLWTVVYFALFLWATFTGQPLGGPLSYPVGLLFAAVSSSIACIVLFLPSTLLAEWTAWRLRWPVLLQIPISLVWLCLLSVAAVTVIAYTGTPATYDHVPHHAGLLILIMLLPLGLYWWAAQGTIAILDVMGRIFNRVSTKDASAPRSQASANYTSNRNRTHGYTPGESLVTKKAPKRGDD